MDQIGQLVVLLNQAISQDANTRNNALQTLNKGFENQQSFVLLFTMLNDINQEQNNQLVGAIFLQNWIKDHYKILDNIQLQQLIREQTLILFFSKNYPIISGSLSPFQYQIAKSLERIATWDFPSNTYIIENILQVPELLYLVIKSIVKFKLAIQRAKVEFLFEKLITQNSDQIFQQLQNKPQRFLGDFKTLETSLKLKLLESKVLIEKQTTILNFIKYAEFFIQLNKSTENKDERDIFMRLIYLSQKCMIRTLTHQKVEDNECSYTLFYIKSYYYDQEYQIPRLSNIQNFSHLLQILQNSEEERNKQEKYLRLILQIVRLINVILDKYSFNPLSLCDDTDGLGIGGILGVGGSFILENAFYEGYFEVTLAYLFNHAMQLSLAQLYYIYYQPEKSFSEEAEDSVVFEIRDSAMELLKTCFINMKSDYITDLLINQLKIFQENRLIISDISNNEIKIPYTIPSNDVNSILASILQRETFYYAMSCLFKLVKQEIDFESWFKEHLYYELVYSNPFYLPLKIQILSLMNKYLDSSMQISMEMLTLISVTCYQLIHGYEQISIKLGAIKCLATLAESLGDDSVEQLSQIGYVIPTLFSECKQMESKIVLMDFAVQLIKVNSLDFAWALKTIINEWQANTSETALALRGKTLQVITQLLRCSPCEIWFQAIELFLAMILESIQPTESMSEVYLTENGLGFFLHLLCQLSLNKNSQALQYLLSSNFNFRNSISQIQSAIKFIILSNMDVWNHCVLVLSYLIILGIADDEKMSQTLIECTNKMYDEVNQRGFARFLFVIELYILSKTERVNTTLNQIIPVLVNKIDNKTTSTEIIEIFHLISVLSYTNSPLIDSLVCQNWFQQLLRIVYNAHKTEIPLHGHQMSLFFFLCTKLLKNDTYMMSQLNIKSDEKQLSQIVPEIFEYLQDYYLKQLVGPQSHIYASFREIISQDETLFRGLLTPDVQGVQNYKITYPILKEEFLTCIQLFQNAENAETLQRIQKFL